MPLSETANLVVNMNLKGDFRKGMAGAQRDLRGFTTQANQTTGRLGRLQGKLKSPELRNGLLQGVGLTGGLIGFQLLGTAVSGAISYMGDAVTAASDLTEAQSKVDEVFEDSAPTVRRWASTIDDSFGITQRAALKSAGTLGNFLVALGQTEKSAADMSTSIVELAGDLASFNNVASEDVLTALQAGLAGEAEPVRRLGIDISVARVEALLLAQGIEKVNGEFTQSQKTLGRYLAIMEDTEKAQGDAARTTDSLAGRQRVLDKQLGELQTQIGTALLPVMTELATVATDELVPAIYQIGESIGPTLTLLGDLKGALDDVVDAIPPEARDFFDNFAGGLGPVPNAIGEVANATGDLIGTGEPLPGLFGDIQGGLQDVQRATIGVNEDTDGLVIRYGSLPNAFAGARNGLNNVAMATEDVSEAERVATRSTNAFAGVFDDLNRALSGSASALGDFREEADAIADTRSLSAINKDLQEQIRIRRRAIEQGKVQRFAEAEANIARLEEEKRLRRLGKVALREAQQNARGSTAAQQLVTAGIADTRKEARRLLRQTRKKYRVKVSVDDQQLASAISKANALAAALNTIGGTIISGVSSALGGGKQSGGPVQAGRAYVVGEQRPELFVPNQNGRILPNVPSGGGDISVYVTPSLVVAAAQVEDQTTKAVRTQRFREKN